jgi:HEPN domain-containing protein
MTGKEKYAYWLHICEYDIETAEQLLKTKRFTYVAVLCQQATERLIKGMFVYHTNKEAPKSHNIMFLLNKLVVAKGFLSSEQSERFLKEKNDYEDFMLDLMFYYINDYPFSYKTVMERFIEEEVAVEIYNKTLQLADWLKSFQRD